MGYLPLHTEMLPIPIWPGRSDERGMPPAGRTKPPLAKDDFSSSSTSPQGSLDGRQEPQPAPLAGRER